MNHHKEETTTIVPILELESLTAVSPLGRGAKGVVFLVREEPTEELRALKVILRELVEKKKKNKKGEYVEDGGLGGYKRICFERQVLSRFNHPLLPRLRGVLSTDKVVGYAMDYCSGRDLNYLRKLQSKKMFNPDVIRFYAAELVLALEYLHNQGIAYRDLKAENILIQENGHIMLVDFDLSTRLSPRAHQPSHIAFSKSKSVSKRKSKPKPKHPRRPSLGQCLKSLSVSQDDRSSNVPYQEQDMTGKSNSFVGTEEYVAPEIIQGHWHDFAVDWWSFGVVLYEMLYGVTPFKGVNRNETFLRILTKTPEFVGELTPLHDLIGKLLVRDPNKRIKLSGIKGHEFFGGVDWDSLLYLARPPYIPPIVNFGETGNTNKKIDVESFVQGLFGFKVDNEESKKENKTDGTNNCEESKHKASWVSEMNTEPRQTDHFLVF